ncbi:MAG TPA: hypothetical protein VN865_01735 [Candidatus Acidoferrales bacterium]|nr:hypothetical protein [Candidatus Acidoferrales bacterium]
MAASLIFAGSSTSRADNLFRLFPEAQFNGFYGDNIPLRTNNEIGDFGTTMVFGFYLDYTSAARYASLHYDTFVQLYTHQTRLDRAGQGQFVNATDDENISPTTKIHFNELFYRDATPDVAIITSDQSPQFNSVLALMLLANFQASINQFNAQLTHDWGHQWSSELDVHQTTYWATGDKDTLSNVSSNSYVQSVSTTTDYHFTNRFSLGIGYRFYDFRFTFPGEPDEQAHWPYVRATWEPLENFYLSGIVGVVISHQEGDGTEVNPGGLGLAEYKFRRGTIRVYGGQEPSITSALGGVGQLIQVNGSVLYNFTPRISGSAGAGYFQSDGTDFHGKVVTWGVGVSDQLSKWLSVYTRFIQVRREESGSSSLLPSGNESGQWAVGDYYIVGVAVSAEAFRWSWQ